MYAYICNIYLYLVSQYNRQSGLRQAHLSAHACIYCICRTYSIWIITVWWFSYCLPCVTNCRSFYSRFFLKQTTLVQQLSYFMQYYHLGRHCMMLCKFVDFHRSRIGILHLDFLRIIYSRSCFKFTLSYSNLHYIIQIYTILFKFTYRQSREKNCLFFVNVS